MKSRWCSWELGEVLRLNKRLIPVVIDVVPPDALPEVLGRISVLPSEGVFDAKKHLPALVAALSTDVAWLKEHTRFDDRARQWIGRDRASALLLRGVALKDAQAWADRKPSEAPAPSVKFSSCSWPAAARRYTGSGLRSSEFSSSRWSASAWRALPLCGDRLAVRPAAHRGRAATASLKRARRAPSSSRSSPSSARHQSRRRRKKRGTTSRRRRRPSNGLVFDIAQDIGNVEGVDIEDVQKGTGSLSRAQSISLLEAEPDNAGLQHIRAAMFDEFRRGLPSGRRRGCGAFGARGSAEIFQALVEREPENPQWRRDSAVSMNKVGDARLRIKRCSRGDAGLPGEPRSSPEPLGGKS